MFFSGIFLFLYGCSVDPSEIFYFAGFSFAIKIELATIHSFVALIFFDISETFVHPLKQKLHENHYSSATSLFLFHPG